VPGSSRPVRRTARRATPSGRSPGRGVDAYLCYPGHEAVWDEQWSRVLNADGSVDTGRKKGYAEVAW
jgi:hypothetical protein